MQNVWVKTEELVFHNKYNKEVVQRSKQRKQFCELIGMSVHEIMGHFQDTNIESSILSAV